jgi:hypothetical protein
LALARDIESVSTARFSMATEIGEANDRGGVGGSLEVEGASSTAIALATASEKLT